MVQINGKDYSLEDIQALKELASVFKNDPASLVPNATPAYGPYDNSGLAGVLSIPGIRPEMYSAFVRPRTFMQLVGIKPSVYAHEKIGIMTGVTAESGTNATDFCGNPPIAGQLKRCVQDYLWGQWYMKTKLNVVPLIGQRYDYADTAKRIVNLANSGNPFMPDILSGINLNDNTQLRLANELFTVGVGWERANEKVAATGDHTQASTATETGWIREYDGLELQIITGRRDRDTNALCPAADSIVLSWGASIEATVSGRTLPQAMVDIWFGRMELADQVGLGGTSFAWIMPSRLFRALTYVYSCSYYTSRCAGTQYNENNQMATETRRIQLEMLNGHYLLMDGEVVPVVFSDGIPVTKAVGNIYTADSVYLVPVEWNGSRFLNMEYFPMNNADLSAFINFLPGSDYQVINNGQFLVSKRYTPLCLEYHFAAMSRLILDAPFLAARIDDVQFTYLDTGYRSAYPSESNFYVDGGNSSWEPNSYHY
jgi:hypothetical protein